MAYTSNREGEALVLSRLADLQRRCQSQDRPCYLGFLDDFQQKVCRDALRKSPVFHRFYGGCQDAERVFLGLSPWEDRGLEDRDFPIRCVEAVFRRQDRPGHRDFLGAVLGLELRREAVGDILVEEGKARIFLTGPAAEVVLAQLTQAGRGGVVCRESLSWGAAARQYEEISGSIASLRLDCVTAFLAGVSRSEALALVSGGQVAIDGQTAAAPARTVELKEKISIRGSGKFIYDRQLGISKKGKLRVQFRKYS